MLKIIESAFTIVETHQQRFARSFLIFYSLFPFLSILENLMFFRMLFRLLIRLEQFN